MNELWKNIDGYGGRYMVSSYGNIKSMVYNLPRLLAPDKGSRGYMRVTLCNKTQMKRFLVHRLVAVAFVHNPENKPHVNHIDNNPSNNNVSNLEWATRAENIQHAVKQGRKPSYNKGRFGANCKWSIPVLQYSKEGVLLKEWPAQSEAARSLGILAHSISEACRGVKNTTGGFVWKYKSEADKRRPYNYN